ncbi:MAG: UbiA prenyltransferase family protein [Burkholderiales bacterium]|nr:UbiA prenyltransferase family protein [Burkholderiales bacterium]
MSKLAALMRLARPRQWLKNGFVFVGLVFGHGWSQPGLALEALILFASFCLVSSGVYALNDATDRDADRLHPVKRRRPVASGEVGVSAALGFAAAVALAGLAGAWTVSSIALALACGYIAINAAYSLALKHVPVLDVFLIASGFMLRILAGTAGVGIEPSQWLLLCGLMFTLFLGFAKRRAELSAFDGAPRSGAAPLAPPQLARGSGAAAGTTGASPRRVLGEYTPEALNALITVTAASSVIAYGLYTVDARTVAVHGTASLFYTVPVVLYGVSRYLWMLYGRHGGEDPSEDVLRDPHLLGSLLVWIAMVFWLIA